MTQHEEITKLLRGILDSLNAIKDALTVGTITTEPTVMPPEVANDPLASWKARRQAIIAGGVVTAADMLDGLVTAEELRAIGWQFNIATNTFLAQRFLGTEHWSGLDEKHEREAKFRDSMRLRGDGKPQI